VSGAGARTALFADAASFGLVAILLFTTSGLPHVRGQVAGWFVRLRQGLGYVRERPQLRLLIAAQTVAVVFFTIVIPIEVVFAKRTLGAGDAGYGYFLASWGTGMLAGSFLFAALGRVSLRTLLPISTLAIGSAYLVIGASPTLAMACIAAAGGGVGNGVQWVGAMTAVQQLTHLEYKGRVISLLESLGPGQHVGNARIKESGGGATDDEAQHRGCLRGVLAVLGVASVALARAGWRGEPTEGVRLSDDNTIEEADADPAPTAAFEPPGPGYELRGRNQKLRINRSIIGAPSIRLPEHAPPAQNTRRCP
jgi:hypothetical protein